MFIVGHSWLEPGLGLGLGLGLGPELGLGLGLARATAKFNFGHPLRTKDVRRRPLPTLATASVSSQ